MSVPDDVRRSLWQIVSDTGSKGCKTTWSTSTNRSPRVATENSRLGVLTATGFADFCRLPDCEAASYDRSSVELHMWHAYREG